MSQAAPDRMLTLPRSFPFALCSIKAYKQPDTGGRESAVRRNAREQQT